jgi:ribosome-associated translation inhibitor RaiA
MLLDIQARGFTLTDALSDAIGSAARSYAATFRRAVRRVAVRVYDLNGPRGGADKGCLVVADLADGRVIVSTDVDGDLYRAIPRAFAKLRRGTLSRTRRAQAQRRTGAGATRGLVTLRRRDLRDDGRPLDPAAAG